jgi:hypothetical protein
MQLLLRKGARLDLKNEKGQTVWDIARGLKKAHRNRVLEALQASSSVNEQGESMFVIHEQQRSFINRRLRPYNAVQLELTDHQGDLFVESVPVVGCHQIHSPLRGLSR